MYKADWAQIGYGEFFGQNLCQWPGYCLSLLKLIKTEPYQSTAYRTESVMTWWDNEIETVCIKYE